MNFKRDELLEIWIDNKPKGGVKAFNKGKGRYDTPGEKYVTICEEVWRDYKFEPTREDHYE